MWTGALTQRRQPSSTAVLLVAAFGAFLAFLDSTIVNIAFPDIQKSFPTYDISSLSWVLNAYNIVFAAFLVAAGRLADLLGRKRMFVFGVVVFTVASVLCAAASSVEQLVAFRVAQGIGAAILVPASLALVVESFETTRRAHGVGLWGAAAAIASGLGPPVGGALVEVSSWRWVFLVNLPLGLVAMIAARRGLVESRTRGQRRAPDLRGALLLAITLGLLTLGLIKGPEWGWSGIATLGSFVASASALVGFVISSRSHPAPLIDPALLRIRSFVMGNILTVVAATGFYAYLLTHVLFLNYVWHYTLLQAGLAVAPAALIAAVVAAVLGRIADRHGHRLIVAIGAVIWAGSLIWYLQCVGPVPNFVSEWLPGQILQGIGVGATLPVLGSAALARLNAGGSYATASAVVSSARQLGAVLGVALLVILIGTPVPETAHHLLQRGWAMAAVCFIAVASGAVFLGSTRHLAPQPRDLQPARRISPAEPAAAADTVPDIPVRLTPTLAPDGDLIANLPLFADLDEESLANVHSRTEQIQLEAGAYLFHAGEQSDALYVVRSGRLQAIQDDVIIRELGRGEVIGELGLLVNAPRSASIKAVRDSALIRLPKTQFDRIADASLLGPMARVLATRLHQSPRPATPKTASPQVVIALVGVNADAPVQMVAAELLSALSRRVRAIDPGRVDASGLEQAEREADKVVLHATVGETAWYEFCLRAADRVVLVAGSPAPPHHALPQRAHGADLVLAGAPATRADLCQWEQLITPRSVHTVRRLHAGADLTALAARISGHSIGLVLAGGGARAFAHLGVLEELERNGIVVDRFAGTSMGAVIAGLAASGLDAASADAYVYEYFIRHNPMGDYAFPSKGLVRGRRTIALLHKAFGEQTVEELPKQFRCVSVDLLARQTVVHRRGPLADVIGCSLRLPGVFPPQAYGGTIHVDGGLLDNIPVSALEHSEGPLVAVNIGFGSERPGTTNENPRGPRIPGIAETIMRTMTLGSQAATNAALEQADVVIRPSTRGVGLLEFHQIDAAREAGRAAAAQAIPQILALR